MKWAGLFELGRGAVMKRGFLIACGFLLLTLASCGNNAEGQTVHTASADGNHEQEAVNSTESSAYAASGSAGGGEHTEEASVENHAASRQIRITAGESNVIVFQLNDSPAADSLYNQLPLSIWVEDYAGSEKIFYPPEKLDTADTPPAQGPAGTLAYYAPWGNVAVFYGECGGFDGLYALGEAVAGAGFLSALAGEVQIEAVGAPSASAGPAEAESTSSRQAQPRSSSSQENPASQGAESEMSPEENTVVKMNLQIGNSTFTAALEENAAVDSFVSLMKTAPVVIQMSDYAGFEKVGSLGTSLPASNSQTTAQPGDIVLYNGNQIVIFYGSNSWSYTRLGRIDDLTGWEEALGHGDVTVTFSVK